MSTDRELELEERIAELKQQREEVTKERDNWQEIAGIRDRLLVSVNDKLAATDKKAQEMREEVTRLRGVITAMGKSAGFMSRTAERLLETSTPAAGPASEAYCPTCERITRMMQPHRGGPQCEVCLHNEEMANLGHK